MPNPSLAQYEDLPEKEWDLEPLTSGVWTIFPHISIADFEADGKLYMVSQLFPGKNADESLTIQNFLAAFEPREEQKALIAEQMKFLAHVVGNEDYYTGLRIQRSVKTGAKSHFLFGPNEGGGQRFHGWVDALIETEDSALPGLFASGPQAR